ncbi:MAG: hypothetical protein U0V72_04255 [Cytophagales bacterium]
MRAFKLIISLFTIIIFCSAGYFYFTYQSFKNKKILKLESWNLINVSGCGNSLYLIDEYTSTDSFIPKTFWHAGYHDVCKTKKLIEIIKLDTLAQIENIYIYSKNISTKINIKIQDKSSEYPLHFGWNTVQLKSKVQEIEIEVETNTQLGEIVLEGTYLFKLPISEIKISYPKISEFLGVNAFVDDPIGASSIFNHVREYHEAVWNQNGENSFNFNPSFPGFDFDTYYQNFNFPKKSIMPVIQHFGSWLTQNQKGECIPIKQNLNPEIPESYREHAQLMYEFANNYHQKNAGIKYLENWNEPDKFWEGNSSYMTPAYYAAMSSKDFDNHLDTSKASMQSSSPETKLVMAGLIDVKSDYVNALAHWCKNNRKGNFPWSVVNAHLYANDEKIKSGIAPEKFNFNNKVADFVKNCKKVCPAQTEVWLTEYGYDKKNDSPQKVQEIEGYTPEQVQAMWLIRNTLLLSSSGLNRAYQYMLRDTKGTGLYASSGLYGYKNEKIIYYDSWYYLKTLTDVLGDYRFVNRLKTTEPDVYVYQYENDEHLKAFVLWTGVETKKTVKNLKIQLPTRVISLSKIEFSNSTEPIQSKISYSKNYGFDVSEKPYILLEKPVQIKNHSKVSTSDIKYTEPSSLTLTDEQNELNPLFYPQKFEAKSLNNVKTNELSFTDKKFISYLSIFDDEGQSQLKIFAVYNGTQTLVYNGKLSLYKKWKTISVNQLCDKIIIEHENNTSKIGEIVVYEYK